MKEVKITLNGKEFSKAGPAVKDWYDAVAAEAEKKPLNTKEGSDAYFSTVGKYLGISLEEICKHGDLKEVTDAYKQINDNILECFGSGGEDSKN